MIVFLNHLTSLDAFDNTNARIRWEEGPVVAVRVSGGGEGGMVMRKGDMGYYVCDRW